MIRLAEPADAPALTRIARAAFAEYEAEIGQVPPPALQDFPTDIAAGRVWISGAPPDTYAVAFEKGNLWFLENIAVAPDAQGRGLGRKMIAFAEDEGRRRGHDRIALYTNAKMTGNLALYPALGYDETGKRREHGLDRVYFEKRL
ncbi:MAG: GNAT family N-acetyltransferase [Pseudomonadota bacterium]